MRGSQDPAKIETREHATTLHKYLDIGDLNWIKLEKFKFSNIIKLTGH